MKGGTPSKNTHVSINALQTIQLPEKVVRILNGVVFRVIVMDLFGVGQVKQ